MGSRRQRIVLFRNKISIKNSNKCDRRVLVLNISLLIEEDRIKSSIGSTLTDFSEKDFGRVLFATKEWMSDTRLH